MSDKKKLGLDITIKSDLTTSEDSTPRSHRRSIHRHHHHHHKGDSEEDSEKRRRKKGRRRDDVEPEDLIIPAITHHNKDINDNQIDSYGSFSQSSPSSPLQRRKRSLYTPSGNSSSNSNGSMGPEIQISTLSVLKTPETIQQQQQQQQQRRYPPVIIQSPQYTSNSTSPSLSNYTSNIEIKHKQIVIGSARLNQQQHHQQQKERKYVSPSSPQMTFKPLSGNTKSSSFKHRTPSPSVFRPPGDISISINNDYSGITNYNMNINSSSSSNNISLSGSMDSNSISISNNNKGKRSDSKILSTYDLKQNSVSDAALTRSSNTPKNKILIVQHANSQKRPSVMQQMRGYNPSSGSTTTTTSGSGSTSGMIVIPGGSPSQNPQNVKTGGGRKRVHSETFSKTDLLKSFGESWILLLNKSEVYVNLKTLSLVTIFEIQVSKGIAEPWKIVKSFKQFYKLDVRLRYEFANVQIPKLPNKSVFKLEFDKNEPDDKVKELGAYLDEISRNSKITSSQVFNSWVEKGSDIVRTKGLTRPDAYGYLNLVLTHTRKVKKLVVLANPILFFYDGDISDFLDSQKQAIWLGNAKLKRLGGGSNVFAVQAQNGGLFVLEAFENDAECWIKKLTDVINEIKRSLAPKYTWKKALPYGISSVKAGDGSIPTGDDAVDGSANTNSIHSTSSIYGEDSEDLEDGFDNNIDNLSESLTYDKNGALSPGLGETHRVKVFMEKFGPAKRDVDVSLKQAVTALKEEQKNPDRVNDAKFIHSSQKIIRRCEKIMKSTPKDLITSNLLGESAILLQKFRKKYENVVPLKALYNLSQLSRIVEGQNEVAPSGERRKRDLARTYSQSAIFTSPPKIVQDEEEEMKLLSRSSNKHIPHYKRNSSILPTFSHSTSDLKSFVEGIHPHLDFEDIASDSEERQKTQMLNGNIKNASTSLLSTYIEREGDEEEREEKEEKTSKKKRKKKDKRKKKREDEGDEEEENETTVFGDNEFEESMASEMANIINSDKDEEGDSELLEEEDPSIKQDRSLIICRMCEEEYPRYLLQEHTEYCAYVESLITGDMACDNRIDLLVNSLAEQRENQERQFPNLDLSSYTKVIIIGHAVARLQYGSEEAKNRCFNLLSELHWYLDNGSYDLLLLAFGKKLIKVIEEKYSVMSDFLKVHTKGLVSNQSSASMTMSPTVGVLSTPTSTAKKSRKKGNFWGMLMFMRPGRVESETIRAINTAYKSRIKIGDFRLIKKISSGAYGKVFLARKNKTNDLYAVKVLKKEDTLRKNMTDNVIAERKILASINNPFVVNLYYAFQNTKYLYLVMEYCPGGDVGTLLKNLGAFDLEMTRIYAAETVLALESMHKLNFVHRDLKPDNLLISATGHVVLTDFGLSTWGVMMGGDSSNASDNTKHKQQQPQQEHRIFGTPDYLAPEILLGTGHGPEVDWWALGAMVFEFITSVPPFNDDSPEKIFDNIMNLRIPWPSEEDGFPPVARDFIEKLLVLDVEKRLGHNGAAEIKEHPFFEGINWDTLIYESREDIFIPQIEDPEDTSYFEDHGSVNDLQPGQSPVVDSSEEMKEMEAETAAMMSAEAASSEYVIQRKQKKYAKDTNNDTQEDDFSDFEYTNTELIKKKTIELAINANDIFGDDANNYIDSSINTIE